MSQLDTKVPRVFGTRVEAACDRPCGLFSAQHVEDVFNSGLSDLIKPNARELDSQFPNRPMADTVAAAQGFREGANPLHHLIKAGRPPLIKVSQIDSAPAHPQRTVDGPYAPVKAFRTDAPNVVSTPDSRANDNWYNCNEPGHFASRCPKPRQERRQALVMALMEEEVCKQVNAIFEKEVLRDSSSYESTDSKTTAEETDSKYE
eukprot:contig_1725_g270